MENLEISIKMKFRKNLKISEMPHFLSSQLKRVAANKESMSSVHFRGDKKMRPKSRTKNCIPKLGSKKQSLKYFRVYREVSCGKI